MKPSELMYKSAEYLIEKGWCQNRLFGDNGEACLLGAMEAVEVREDQLPHWGYERTRINDVLAEITGDPTGMLYPWNNAPERTAEDVILAFKEAGARLEAEGL
jgi:hypothetical protein